MGDVVEMLRKVRRVVLRRGVSPQDADDILQEAFVRMEAYTRIHEVRSQEAFLVTAALNVYRDQMRRGAHAPWNASGLDIETIADRAPLPEEHLRMQEKLRRANAGLARLDPITRRCLLSQRMDGMTFPQIAKREGMSTAAVEKRVARAILFLTQWMDEA